MIVSTIESFCSESSYEDRAYDSRGYAQERARAALEPFQQVESTRQVRRTYLVVLFKLEVTACTDGRTRHESVRVVSQQLINKQNRYTQRLITRRSRR
eukprot:scaffold49244_cov52-Attheya_sp.AAC.7